MAYEISPVMSPAVKPQQVDSSSSQALLQINIIHFQGAQEDRCHVVGYKLRLDSWHDTETTVCVSVCA